MRRSVGQTGFTLVELIVAMLIGSLLTTAAVAFVRSESKLMGVTEDRLEITQASRVVLNLIASDLRSAGLGLRPTANQFDGLLTGAFNVGPVAFGPGNIQLEQADVDQAPGAPTNAYNRPTQDLGVRLADGDQATIVAFDGTGGGSGNFTVCDNPGLNFRNNEVVLLQDQTSLSTWAVELTNVGASSVCAANCASGCVPLTWQRPVSPAHRYVGNSGDNVDYRLGQMFGEFKTVVWFLVPDPNRPNRGVLRRMTWDDTQPDCAARDNNCGALVARNVEAFYYRVYQFTPDGGWLEIAPGGAPDADGRIRVDIELVMRAEESSSQTFNQIQAELAPGAPAPFPQAARDRIARRVFRATVELRNAGRIDRS